MLAKKVLVIGLDGATIDSIKHWVNEGYLFHLGSLMKQGVYGHLETVPNMNSAPAWTSIYTGRNPGNHGIFFFYEKKENSYEIRYLNGDDCDAPPIWSILSRAGKKVGVINVPMTYPARQVNGFMISGMDAPRLNSKAVFPESVFQEIKTNFPEYKIELGLLTYARQKRYDKLIKKVKESIKMRTKVALHFMEKMETDFFMVVYREIDIIQHVFWKFDEEWYKKLRPDMAERFKGTILDLYKSVDNEIGKLLERITDDTTVFVVSDHGGAPLDYGIELLSDFLVETGYLSYIKKEDAGMGRFYMQRIMRMTLDIVSKYFPRSLKEFLLNFLPELYNKTSGLEIFSSIDWQRSKILCTTRPELWINLKGREPLGIVERGKPYDDLILELKEKLLGWVDTQTGEQIIQDVRTKEEVYYGKNLNKAADVILYFNRNVNPTGIALKNKDNSLSKVKEIDPLSRVDYFISGSHADTGIVIIKGPDIKAGRQIENVSGIDVTPTILYILLGADFGLDGKIIEQAFREDVFKNNPFIKARIKENGDKISLEYSQEESKIIEERLRNLGYL